MKNILETDRLVLREWAPADVAVVLEMCGDPEVMRYVGDGRPWGGVERARGWIERAREAYATRGWSRWAVVEKGSGLVVGSCGFGIPYDTGETDFGYMYTRAHWGKGYATEAARACMRYGFGQLGFDEVIASVDPQNLASAGVLEKVGFTLRGLRRFEGEAEDSLFYLATRPGGGDDAPAG